MNQKCDYGCGCQAKYTFKNGKNCCSESVNTCPSMKKKNSNGNKGRAKHKFKKLTGKSGVLCSYGCGRRAVYLTGQSVLKPCCSKYYSQCTAVVEKASLSNAGSVRPRGKDSKLFGRKRPDQSLFMKKNNPMYDAQHREKHAAAIASDEYKTSMSSIITERWASSEYREKYRKSMEEKGHWVPHSDLKDFDDYKALVRAYTARSIYEHYYEINPENRKIGINDHHIDHIYSVVEGFKNGILPAVIGSHINLQVLPARENIRKYSNSWMSKEELLERYSGYENSF